MSMTDVEMLFKFIGGLGMFLYGMHVMAEGLQKTAGGKMKKLLGILTNNRLLAVLVGAGVTAIIQRCFYALQIIAPCCLQHGSQYGSARLQGPE